MTTPLNRPPADTSGGEDDVAGLLRLACPRPEVDPGWAALARPVVHQAWRNAVRRRRWRWAAWGASAAALVALSLTLAWRPRPAPEPATVAVVVVVAGPGPVAVDSSPADGNGTSVGIGHAVASGAHVTTTATSRVTLSLPKPRGQLRLDVDTRVQLAGDGVISVERGGIYLDAGLGHASGRRFEVRTPQGIVRDSGTRFEVRVTSASLRVRVREGAVTLTHYTTVREAQAGSELTVSNDAITERTVQPYDAEWEWTTALAPPFVLEGQTLRAFLAWASAEGGWHVRYVDDRRSAEWATIVLHGDIEGLTPAEALAAVLPTCGLTHRNAEAEVLIDALPDGRSGH